MSKPDLSYAMKLAPEAAIQYLSGKKEKPSWEWWNTWQEAHAHAFTVAKGTQIDVLKDIHEALISAAKEGKSVQQFRNDLEPLLKQKGWWGVKEVPYLGYKVPAKLGTPRRLDTIYRANMASAEAAGRYKDFVETATERPYWQYKTAGDSRVRAAHAALADKVFRWDDPFWDKFFPPNGWGCRCYVKKLSKAEARRMGVEPKGPDDGKIRTETKKIGGSSFEGTTSTYTTPDGRKASTEAGWDYNPGQAWHLDELNLAKAKDLPAALKTKYLADMGKNNLIEKTFPIWVEDLMTKQKTGGIEFNIGYLPPEVMAKLPHAPAEEGNAEKFPEGDPLLSTGDNRLFHIIRAAKENYGKMIDKLVDFPRLPTIIKNYGKICLDEKSHKQPAVIIYSKVNKDKKRVKMVFEPFKDKKTVKTQLISAEMVPAEEPDKYLLLDKKE